MSNCGTRLHSNYTFYIRHFTFQVAVRVGLEPTRGG